MKWDAQKYDTGQAPQIDAGRELIALARVRESDDILDLGCGTGRLTIELARQAAQGSVTGLDPSDEMLEKARTIAAPSGNLRLLRMNAEDMTFDDQFDLVFSNSAIQWIADQPRAVRASFRALRTHGRIAFQLPAQDFCPAFFSGVETAISELGYERFFQDWRSPWHFPGHVEFGAALANAGFRSVDIFSREYALQFDSRQDVTAWWSSAGLRPYLAALPGNAEGYFLDSFGRSFEKHRTEKGIEFGFRRLFAFGIKE